MKNLNDYCKSNLSRNKYLIESSDSTIYLTFYGCDSNIECSYIDEHIEHYRGLCCGYNDNISIGIEGKEFAKSSSDYLKSNTMEYNIVKLSDDVINIRRYDNKSTYGCRLRINEKYFDLNKMTFNIQPLNFIQNDIIIETTPILYSIMYDDTEYKLNYISSDNEESMLVWGINPVFQLT